MGFESNVFLWSFRNVEFPKLEPTACGKHLSFYLSWSGSKQARKSSEEGHCMACSHSFIHGALLVSSGGIKTFLKIIYSQSFQTLCHLPVSNFAFPSLLHLPCPLHLRKWPVFVRITLILETFPALFTNDDNLIQ